MCDYRTVRLSGRFSRDTFVSSLRLFDEDRKATFLCDVRDMDFCVPSREVVAAARDLAHSEIPEASRMAFLTGGPLGFGMIRMFLACVGRAADLLEVFDDEATAVDWLCRDSVAGMRIEDGADFATIVRP